MGETVYKVYTIFPPKFVSHVLTRYREICRTPFQAVEKGSKVGRFAKMIRVIMVYEWVDGSLLRY